MTAYFRVVGLEKYQHYRDRRPPWIKLHASVLDDFDFGNLPDASKAHAMLIWVLASRHDNRLPYEPHWIGQRIQAQQPVDLDGLLSAGFITMSQDASVTSAECSGLPTVETEAERETETEKTVATQPGEPDSDLNPMGACMGALREALYVGGKDPGTGASDRDATIIRGWLRKGRAASEVVAAIRGFGAQRDAGLLPWPPGTPLTVRALNSMIAGKNPYPAAVDYWYAHRDRAPPETKRERTGPTSIGDILKVG